jgi:GntR family histidine utilization transcriptional repressor
MHPPPAFFFSLQSSTKTFRRIRVTPASDTENGIPLFQQVKSYILSQIKSSEWKEGDRIPTEISLCTRFGASRMTINRALRELTSEQILRHVQGDGTYVAQQKYRATIVEIKSIADEIRARGHVHTCEVLQLSRKKADAELAVLFNVRPESRLFHSVLVHFEEGVPIQVEKRWVNPVLAPDYLEQDFTRSTPNEYLMKVAPLEGVSYRIEAIQPPLNIRKLLKMSKGNPCLVLYRTTRSLGAVASSVTMWHPGNSYQFIGSF